MLSKFNNTILALLFLLFAAVQLNDPDPVVWVLIYLNMVAVCVWAMFRTPNRYWLWISGATYLVYAVILLPGAWQWVQSPDRSLLFDDLAKMQFPYIEETRECLGLLICVVVIAWQLWKRR